MSKICIMLVHNSIDNTYNIISEIKHIVDDYGWGYFILDEIDEPFLHRNKSDLIISFSDNYVYDNCEMLLLPDDCIYNGKENKKTLFERMEMICNVVKFLKQNNHGVELYIGDSGTECEDYSEYACLPSILQNTICNGLNHFNNDNLHIIVI